MLCKESFNAAETVNLNDLFGGVVVAYHVSGEYALVMAAAQNGWLDADKAFYESMISLRRAGADFIFTYAAKRVAQLQT